MENYRLRVQACTVAALLLLIAVVHFWPPPGSNEDAGAPYRIVHQELIEFEEVLPTSQRPQAPPPPSPPIPIVLPDEVVLDEQELNLSDVGILNVEDPAADQPIPDGPAATRPSSTGMTVGPKAVRFVEPEYTREARRRRVRAEVVVEVLVGDEGRVIETRIDERFLLDGDGTEKTPVSEVGYGLEEAALSAAKRWVFRPARENGKPVSSYTTLTFTFGV